jgi:hypothetical protein
MKGLEPLKNTFGWLRGFARERGSTILAALGVATVAAEVFDLISIYDTVENYVWPEDPRFAGFWQELYDNGIVDVPYDARAASPITNQVLTEMLSGHGFDIERNDGSSDHFEIIKDKAGKIDLVHLEFETGTGPVLHENSAEAIEHNNRWRWSGPSAARDISASDYAAASEYFKEHGYHPYKVGEKILNMPAVLAAVHTADHSIEQADLYKILAKGGYFVDTKGTAFQIWFNAEGKPEVHQLPAKESYPHLELDPNGKRVHLRGADVVVPVKPK